MGVEVAQRNPRGEERALVERAEWLGFKNCTADLRQIWYLRAVRGNRFSPSDHGGLRLGNAAVIQLVIARGAERISGTGGE